MERGDEATSRKPAQHSFTRCKAHNNGFVAYRSVVYSVVPSFLAIGCASSFPSSPFFPPAPFCLPTPAASSTSLCTSTSRISDFLTGDTGPARQLFVSSSSWRGWSVERRKSCERRARIRRTQQMAVMPASEHCKLAKRRVERDAHAPIMSVAIDPVVQ